MRVRYSSIVLAMNDNTMIIGSINSKTAIVGWNTVKRTKRRTDTEPMLEQKQNITLVKLQRSITPNQCRLIKFNGLQTIQP